MRLRPSAHRCSCSRNRGIRTVRARSATDYRLSTICAAPRQSFLYPYDYYADLEPYYNNERNAIGCRNYNQAYPQTQLVECTGKSVSLTDAGALFLKEGSMPLSYAETRNIVFLKSAVLGLSLLTEKKGTYEWNHQSN